MSHSSPNASLSSSLRTIVNSRSRHRFALGAIAFVISLVIFLQFLIYFSGYRRHVHEAEKLTETIVRIIEDQTQRSLQSALLILEATRSDIAEGYGPLDRSSVHARTRNVPELRGLYLLDENGLVLDSTLSADDIGASVREHDYYQQLRDSPSLALAMGAPLDKRHLSGPAMPGLAFVPMAIRLTSQPGFLVAAINMSFLELQYRSLMQSSNLAVTLASYDGRILMDSRRTWAPGLDVSRSDPIFTSYLPATEAATFTRPAKLGKEAQIVSFRLTRSFPIAVIAAMDVTAVWNGWIGANLPMLAPTFVAVVLVVFALVHLARQFVLIARQQAELRSSRDAAQAASQAKSQFLAVMSHEIRTPMNAVLGLSNALLQQNLPQDQKELVATIHRSGDSLLQLVNDILDYSKLEAGRIELELVPFSIRSMVDDTMSIVRGRALSKGLSLTANVAPSVPPCLVGDVGRLRQVLLNLTSNAIKFTSRGSVGVEISAAPGESGKTAIEIVVRDTGIGIAEDAVSTLFRDFVQADASINRRFGGSGLGLSICKRILDAMGGGISIASHPGEGTAVTVSVDLEIGTEERAAEGSKTDAGADLKRFLAQHDRKLRLLVVDDETTNRLVAKKLLENLDILVDTATDGTEAVTAAAHHLYDIILMDMRMPEMDGIEATRAIRSGNGPNRKTPIIALTANAFAEDRDACTAAGMNGFVAKPVRLQTLAAGLLSVLQDQSSLRPAA